MRLPTQKQKEFFETAACSYELQLQSDTSVQAFLQRRQIGPEVAGLFRLGVVREPLVGHEAYTGRLAVPFITESGIVDFVFRCITLDCTWCADGGHAKYLASSSERTLYNVRDLETPSQTIHVTEGELDALTLSMCGMPAVGVGGVKGWKPYFTICLQDFAEVFVWGDGDKDGRNFAKFIKDELGARPVALPEGEDVNSVYVGHGVEGLRRLVTR